MDAENTGEEEPRALRASEARLVGILSAIEDLVFVVDEEKRFTSLVHAPHTEKLYAAPDAFIGKKVAEVMPPHVSIPFDQAFACCERGESSEYEYLLETGGEKRWFSSRVSPLRIEGRFAGIVAVIRDITARRGLVERLRVSEEKYRAAFNASPDLCYRVDPDCFILEVNDTVVSRLGYSREELIGRHVFDLYAQESRPDAKECFREWLRTGKLRDKRLTVLTKDGDRVEVELNVNTVHGHGGEALFSVSVQRDVTQRKPS